MKREKLMSLPVKRLVRPEEKADALLIERKKRKNSILFRQKGREMSEKISLFPFACQFCWLFLRRGSLFPGKLCGPFLDKGCHALAMVSGGDRQVLQLALQAERSLQVIYQGRIHEFFYHTIGTGWTLGQSPGKTDDGFLELCNGYAYVGQAQALGLGSADLIGQHGQFQ